MTFKSGQSGNPSGRPRGMKDRRTIFRDMIEPTARELVDKAVNMAMNGNEQMLKLLLERLLPPKPQEDTVDMSLKLKSKSLSEQSMEIVNEVAKGNLPISEGLKMMKTLETQTKVFEFDVLKKDIEDLKMKVFGK